MKSFSYALTILLTLCAGIYAQTGPTGTWRVERVGAAFPWEAALKADGSRLGGMVSSCASNRGAFEIFEGKIDGNMLTFKCKSGDFQRTVTITGRINGDEIGFTWELQDQTPVPADTYDGIFGASNPPRFTAKRVPDSALAELADRTRGVEFAAAVNLLQRDAKVEGMLFVPEKVSRIRAVIVATNWGLGQYFYDDPQLRRLLATTESGVLLARFSNMGPSIVQWRNRYTADGADALVMLLQRLAQESGHPELADAPLLFYGHSAGGGGVFADLLPERTVAFVDYHSERGGADPKLLSQIPALFLAGGTDTGVPWERMQRLWSIGRSVGAPWTFAVEPDVTHGEVKKGDDLMIPWITAVLRQRLSPDGPTLRPVTDAPAWLGNNRTGEVAPYSAFAGSKLEASWLPDEASARAWRVVLGGAK